VRDVVAEDFCVWIERRLEDCFFDCATAILYYHLVRVVENEEYGFGGTTDSGAVGVEDTD
jgi:hypothetical protein